MQYSTEAFCLSQSANQMTCWISFTGADQSLGVMRALVCEWIDQSHTVRVCLKKQLIGTGCFFFTGPPSRNLEYGKPRLGEVRCI